MWERALRAIALSICISQPRQLAGSKTNLSPKVIPNPRLLFWSAATCRRFGLRRLDAAMPGQTLLGTGCDRSQPTKALTGQRTSKLLAHSKELPREAVAVFTRDDEGLNHFRLLEVAVELVQLGEPESETICIWISSQVTELFHHHKSVVELGANETTVLSDLL